MLNLKNIQKKYIYSTAAVIIVIIIGVIGFAGSKQVKYNTKTLKRCTITEVVEASGTINPVNTVSVGSTVSGLIKEIYVDYNDVVKKGQILAQIDPANLKQQFSKIKRKSTMPEQISRNYRLSQITTKNNT